VKKPVKIQKDELYDFECPSRKAKGTTGTTKAWYYVNRNSIDVYGASANNATQSVRLTRKQLEEALAFMRSVE
jgi:hypothetical protein